MVPILGTIAIGVAVKLATELVSALAKKALGPGDTAPTPKPEFTVPSRAAETIAVAAPNLPFDLAGKLAADRAAAGMALDMTAPASERRGLRSPSARV